MNTNTKYPVLEAQVDTIVQLRDNLHFGAMIIYDDKAKAIEMLRYGLFWRLRPSFLIGLDYNRTGDKTKIETTMTHKVNKDTKVGTTVEYNLNLKKFHSKTAF
jgi:hypothetical protein